MSHVFFTDRDLGNVFPEALRTAGLRVEQHSGHFRHDTPDEEWLAAVGGNGWVALSRDHMIRYRPNEREAVVQHQVGLLIMIGKARHADLAQAFIRTIPRIESFLDRQTRPFIGKIYRPSAAELRRNDSAAGRVELWYPPRP